MARKYVWPLSAEDWGARFSPPISPRRVEVLAEERRIRLPDGSPGARRIGRALAIHPDAIDPRMPPGRPKQPA